MKVCLKIYLFDVYSIRATKEFSIANMFRFSSKYQKVSICKTNKSKNWWALSCCGPKLWDVATQQFYKKVVAWNWLWEIISELVQALLCSSQRHLQLRAGSEESATVAGPWAWVRLARYHATTTTATAEPSSLCLDSTESSSFCETPANLPCSLYQFNHKHNQNMFVRMFQDHLSNPAWV